MPDPPATLMSALQSGGLMLSNRMHMTKHHAASQFAAWHRNCSFPLTSLPDPPTTPNGMNYA